MKRVLLLLKLTLNFLLVYLLSCGTPRVADRERAIDKSSERLDVQFRPDAEGQFPGKPLSCEAMELLRFTAVVTGGDGDYSHMREDGISFRNAERIETKGNILYDNGRIWEDRISGISFNGVFRDVSVHNNLVVNSNSDGIELMGDTQRETAANVEVYANVLRDNGEQGVWLFRVQNGWVHHNYILGSHNNGVCLEGWVSGIKVDHNIIVRCGGMPEMKHHGGGAVAIQYSRDNTIQCNILVDSSCGDVSISCPERYEEDWIWKMDEGFQEAAGNVVDGNVLCSSEFNISIASGVSAATVTNNVVWQRGRGRNYHGFHPHESNIKGMPLFRAPERGDYTLLSSSPGSQIFCRR